MKPLAYYATVQHAQWALATDGMYLDLIRDGKGDARVRAAVAMFRDYRVARTIRGTDGLQKLAKQVFAAEQPWPSSLLEQAKWCENLAKTFKCSEKSSMEGGNGKQGAPYSAVSKLCWFMHPDGWMMFDKYARIGLSGNVSFLGYYADLEKNDFFTKVRDLNRAIKGRAFKGLYGERIIDKFLMLRGTIWSAVDASTGKDVRKLAAERGDHFLSNLAQTHEAGRGLSNALMELADFVAAEMPDDAFKTGYVRKKLEKRPLV